MGGGKPDLPIQVNKLVHFFVRIPAMLPASVSKFLVFSAWQFDFDGTHGEIQEVPWISSLEVYHALCQVLSFFNGKLQFEAGNHVGKHQILEFWNFEQQCTQWNVSELSSGFWISVSKAVGFTPVFGVCLALPEMLACWGMMPWTSGAWYRCLRSEAVGNGNEAFLAPELLLCSLDWADFEPNLYFKSRRRGEHT